MSISKNSPYPKVDHITLTVKNFQKSKLFYTDLFVNYLGGKIEIDDSDLFGIIFLNGFLFEIREESVEFKDSKFNCYQVGLHHFALELESKEAIDKVCEKLLELNVEILDKPTFYPEYTQGYYAVYWKDLNGFKMEFMCIDKT
jgi:catechol 2,3-dioxygenase-like lactoylglutathione lyase family enzyme